jgi:radical SAM superfamily enzyme YgiQ (UPF0313 family)
MSSRGCPNGCIFCCESALYGRKFRARSAENVVDEMTLLARKYGVGHIVIYDASFMVDPARVERICDEMINRSLNVSWRARVRADQLNEALVAKMKSAGCSTLAIGVESGSQRLLDLMGKRCRIEEIENAFKIAQDAGLWTVGYFMFGTPTETREESYRTVEFAKKLDPDWALFTHATPLPGTELYEMNKEKMLTDDWARFKFSANSPVASYDGMSEREMQEMMDYAFRSFYVRKDWLLNRLKKVSTPAQVERVIDSFMYYVHKTMQPKASDSVTAMGQGQCALVS